MNQLQHPVYNRTLDLLNPLRHPVCLAEIERSAISAWQGHVPFAMWLISVLRPKVMVELGAHNGLSYCAMCQAKKALNYAGRFHAIDTWQGDTQAGFYSEGVLENLRQHHDPRYADFSRLMQSTFDDALPQFADGSVDLLHIDGLHTYEAVRHDWETWRPKLSDRAIVLFHDTAVRKTGFGVWNLWAEITTDRPHFEFMHSAGLGVLGIGQGFPPELECLFRLTAAEADQVRLQFESLARAFEMRDECQRLRNIDAVLNGVYQSLSWKITAPLRQAKFWLKKCLGPDRSAADRRLDAA
ncbi:MAG: class I SAM-dependent methyltransferase [Planctomycetes bacterium]|nr:class I SAM-dependent methyltransferase [Planctomycetota bacterium]